MKSKLLTLACCFGVVSLSAQIPTVSSALFMSVDVSGSIDSTEYAIQKTGYANAFSDPVITNLFNGTGFSLAVKYSEWAADAPGTEAGWVVIDSPADSLAFSTTLAGLTRSTGIGSTTDIAGAMDYAGSSIAFSLGRFFNVETDGDIILDVSGDGGQNDPISADVAAARDGAMTNGFTEVNGLPIGNDTGDTGGLSLADYYATNVQSANGFTFAADSFADFEASIKRKIFFEITGGEIPEPTTIGLMGVAGIAAFVLIRRRKQAPLANS